jgi:1-deoxy-D-xylulose-5-phosphate synthase
MLALLRLGVEQRMGPYSVRYPRDNVPAPVPTLDDIPLVEFGTWEVLRKGKGIAILAVGTMVLPALAAARQLETEGVDATVVNCRFLKPLDEDTLAWVMQRHGTVLTVEEGTVVNGFGAMLARHIEPGIAERPGFVIDTLGVPDRIIEHASRNDQLAQVGLDVAGIANRVRNLAMPGGVAAIRETA